MNHGAEENSFIVEEKEERGGGQGAMPWRGGGQGAWSHKEQYAMALSVTSLPIACVVASTRSLCGCMHDESLFEFLPQGCLTLWPLAYSCGRLSHFGGNMTAKKVRTREHEHAVKPAIVPSLERSNYSTRFLS
ncbi:hypothetical protein EJB05_52524, partial [Eragrostis curvula]